MSSSQAFEEPDSGDGWSKIGVLMLILAAALAVVVAYVIATNAEVAPDAAGAVAPAKKQEVPGGSTAEKVATAKSESAQPTENSAVEPSKTDLPPPDSETQPALRENGEVDRPAGLISLVLESEPSGASVIRNRDGVRLGKTPYTYSVEPGPGHIEFLLQLDGHKTISVSLPADRNGVRQVLMLPGEGGEIVPDAPPKDTAKVQAKPETEAPSAAESIATSKSPVKKPVKTVAEDPKPKKRTRTKKPSVPAKRKKKSSGTIDYSADPLPFD